MNIKQDVIKPKPKPKLPVQHIFKTVGKQTFDEINNSNSEYTTAALEELPQSSCKQISEENNNVDNENFRKSTLIFMTENHDDDEYAENEHTFRRSVSQGSESSSISTSFFPNKIRTNEENKGYSNQAALLFFEDDQEPEPLPRKRNIKLQDDTSSYSGDC